jgi:PAS domain S-box-containing protein
MVSALERGRACAAGEQASGRPVLWLAEDALAGEASTRSLGGHELQVVADCASLLDRLALSGAPDVVILGERLPEERALEACRRVRERGDPWVLPILALVSARHAAAALLGAGANDCVAQPCDAAELRARLEFLTRMRRTWLSRDTERDRLRMATEASGVATWDYDPATGEVLWDARVKELLGVSPARLDAYELFLAAVHPAERQKTHDAVQRAIDPGGTGEYHIQCRTIGIDDRRERWIATQGRAFFAGGKAVRFVGTCLDITEQKRAERSLDLLATAGSILADTREYEARVEAAARLCVGELADVAVIDLLDGADGLRLAAVAHEERAVEERIRALRLAHPPDAARHPAFAVLRSGEPRFEPEIDAARRDEAAGDEGHARMVQELALGSLVVVPLLAREHRLGALTLGRRRARMPFDHADLRVAEELGRLLATAGDNARLLRQTEEALETAEAANRLRDEFLAVVSHELRTPLAAILGWTRVLASESTAPEKRARAVAAVERNARAQAQLVDDLLDFSSLVVQKLELAWSDVDVARATEAAIDALRAQAEAKGVLLDARLDRAVGAIRGDAARIQQIAWNLVSNAVKFTPTGGRVTISVRREGAWIALEVADTGEGIPPAFLPSVFERFRQADSSATRAHGGLGLGLSIVKPLVELHGGRIEARSDGVGQGAAFVARFPARS